MAGRYGEPWSIGGSYLDRMESGDGETDAHFNGIHCEERMERAALCLNSLAGISSESLEAGAVRKLVEAAVQALNLLSAVFSIYGTRSESKVAALLQEALEPFAGLEKD